jgi:TP901 family phage tail tape measure protein
MVKASTRLDVEIAIRDLSGNTLGKFSKKLEATGKKGRRAFKEIETGAKSAAVGASTAMGTIATSASTAKTAVAGLGAALKTAVPFLAIAAVLREAATAGTELSLSLAEVGTLINASAEESEQMEEGVRRLAFAMGVAQAEVAKGLYQTISAGVTDATDALELLEVATRLSVAGLTTVDVAVDGLTSVLNAYGLEASDAADVSDVFLKAVFEGKTTTGELASSIGSVLPLAAQLGVDFATVASAIAAMTAQGINTNEAITKLNAVFIQLIKSGDKIDDLFRSKLGKGFDRANLSGQGFADTLQDIFIALDGDTTAIREMLVEIRAVTGFLALTGDQSQLLSDKLASLDDRLGSTAQSFDRIQQSSGKRALDALKVFGNVLATVGEGFLDTVFLTVDGVKALAEGISIATSDTLDLAQELLGIDEPTELAATTEGLIRLGEAAGFSADEISDLVTVIATVGQEDLGRTLAIKLETKLDQTGVQDFGDAVDRLFDTVQLDDQEIVLEVPVVPDVRAEVFREIGEHLRTTLADVGDALPETQVAFLGGLAAELRELAAATGELDGPRQKQLDEFVARFEKLTKVGAEFDKDALEALVFDLFDFSDADIGVGIGPKFKDSLEVAIKDAKRRGRFDTAIELTGRLKFDERLANDLIVVGEDGVKRMLQGFDQGVTKEGKRFLTPIFKVVEAGAKIVGDDLGETIKGRLLPVLSTYGDGILRLTQDFGTLGEEGASSFNEINEAAKGNVDGALRLEALHAQLLTGLDKELALIEVLRKKKLNGITEEVAAGKLLIEQSAKSTDEKRKDLAKLQKQTDEVAAAELAILDERARKIKLLQADAAVKLKAGFDDGEFTEGANRAAASLIGFIANIGLTVAELKAMNDAEIEAGRVLDVYSSALANARQLEADLTSEYMGSREALLLRNEAQVAAIEAQRADIGDELAGRQLSSLAQRLLIDLERLRVHEEDRVVQQEISDEAERVRKIMEDGTFGEGFSEGMRQVGEELGTAAERGADFARDIAGATANFGSNLGRSIADGFEDGSAALEAFTADLAALATEELTIRLLGSLGLGVDDAVEVEQIAATTSLTLGISAQTTATIALTTATTALTTTMAAGSLTDDGGFLSSIFSAAALGGQAGSAAAGAPALPGVDVLPPQFADGGVLTRSFASGGVVSQPTLGLFGEVPGKSELFVPLEGGGVPFAGQDEFISRIARTVRAEVGSTANGGGGGDNNVSLNFEITSPDPERAGDAVLQRMPEIVAGVAAKLIDGSSRDLIEGVRQAARG